MKIVDKVNECIAKGQTVFSFEFFPPRTEEGVENLFDRLDRMAAYGPVFCDITWGAGGSTADVTLDIAKRMQNVVCVETMMHLTCTNMPLEKLDSALAEVRSAGLQNILALRGDPPKGQDKFEVVEGGLACALDLVKHIRAQHGDYFGICVAGYPEAHPDTIVEEAEAMEKNYWENIHYLKQKVEAGGEMVITQLFYDVDLFFKFVTDCRSVGITAPIIPGIMPVMTYGGFKRMTGFCKTKVPEDIASVMEANKDNEEATKAYGVELGAAMCRKLLDGGVPGLHLYSLNLDKTVLAILERMGIIDTQKVPRPLPWAHIPLGGRRLHEGVRPVFWQNRPKAYLSRTRDWQQLPSARWSGATPTPPLADLPEQNLRRHTFTAARRAKAVAAWGDSLSTVMDVQQVFKRFYKGDISLLPWAEMEGGAINKSLHNNLVSLAFHQAMLTINALPHANGISSEDPVLGWGAPKGQVYQRAYLEAFMSPDTYKALRASLQTWPSVSFIATSSQGLKDTNMAAGSTTALSWGVFPGQEVVQPLVVDMDSFKVWKDEAFALWTAEWGSCYEEGSASRALLEEIASTWYLVAMVDNDYSSNALFDSLGATDISAI
ncbi:methylenetetrahydrofolate reductase-domain-containing protein [Haematococcus lacustris]